MHHEPGFICLHRKIMETSFYKDGLAIRLAIHLILKANWKDKKTVFNGEEILVKRGSLIVGRHKLAEELGAKSSTVYHKLVILEKVGFLNSKTNNRFSLISICNYNTYNPLKNEIAQQTEQPVNNKGTASEQPVNTSKEVKELKNKDLNTTNASKTDIKPLSAEVVKPTVCEGPAGNPLKPVLDGLMALHRGASPVRCRSVGYISRARDSFEAELSGQRVTAEELTVGVNKAGTEATFFEIVKKAQFERSLKNGRAINASEPRIEPRKPRIRAL